MPAGRAPPLVAERICLYALVSGDLAPLRMTGITGERLRAVDMAGVEAVVGAQARVTRATTAAMRRYDEVERGLMAVYASVLPARFGTCAAAVGDLAQSVRDRRVSIRRNLRLVRQRVQMTVRIFGSEPAQSRHRAGTEPAQSGHRAGTEQGTQYLQRRAEELQIPGAAAVRDAVARWVRAERTERHMQGRLVGSIYHLIPRGAVPAYRRAIERAALDANVTTIVSGPWPPYAFTE